MAIKSFQHKGLERFFTTGSKSGIVTTHAAKLSRQLGRLDVASAPTDMNLPGWGFHELQGKNAGRYAVSVNGNWRFTFEFIGTDAVLLDYLDYH